jgi:hypothetical protein
VGLLLGNALLFPIELVRGFEGTAETATLASPNNLAREIGRPRPPRHQGLQARCQSFLEGAKQRSNPMKTVSMCWRDSATLASTSASFSCYTLPLPSSRGFARKQHRRSKRLSSTPSPEIRKACPSPLFSRHVRIDDEITVPGQLGLLGEGDRGALLSLPTACNISTCPRALLSVALACAVEWLIVSSADGQPIIMQHAASDFSGNSPRHSAAANCLYLMKLGACRLGLDAEFRSPALAHYA